MAPKIKISGEVLVLPVSELAERAAQISQDLGDSAEALVTRNKDTIGVFMTPERRNRIAQAEEERDGALAVIDLLLAGGKLEDIARSAAESRERRGLTKASLLERIQAKR